MLEYRMGTGVTVRQTQHIGEILMNKKLVTLITLGVTMMLSSHKINAKNYQESITVESLV